MNPLSYIKYGVGVLVLVLGIWAGMRIINIVHSKDIEIQKGTDQELSLQSKLDSEIGKNTELTHQVLDLTAQLDAQKKLSSENQQKVDQLSQKIVEIQQQRDKENLIFAKHNLSNDLQAHPGLIVPKANAATKETFNEFQTIIATVSK